MFQYGGVLMSGFDHHEMLDENKESLKSFFNIIEDYLFVVNESGEIIEANNSALKKLGYSTKELYGESILSVYPPERREEAFVATKQMLEGKIYTSTIPLISKEGNYIYVETRVFRGKWLGENAALGICKDISSLRKEQRFLKSMIDTIPDFVFFKDTEGKYLGCNETFANNFMGLKEDEILGKTDLECIKNKDVAEICIKQDKEMFEDVKTKINEEKIPLEDGNIIEVETVKTPFYDDRGNVAGLIGIARDITKRKKLKNSFEKVRKDILL
jgi:PAS domain S-box-containing protein